MSGDRTNRAIARIEAALARIEAAASQNSKPSGSSQELVALQSRHDRLRAVVTGSLAELDQLIEGAQG
jgi:hypothetical protein